MLSSFASGTLFGERHGSAPLRVLALHGWGRTHDDFGRALGLAGVDAIALDLPGFGATPRPDRAFTSKDYAQVIAPVLDETTEPVVLVGHSHGGRVAVCLAALMPNRVRGIVLIGAPVLRRQATTKPTLRYRVRRLARRLHLVSDASMEKARQRYGSSDYAAADGVMRETLVAVVNESFEEELAALTCPVTFLWGAEDSDVPLEVARRAKSLVDSRNQNAHSTVITLEGVGHLVPTRDPQAVADAIVEMLS